MSFLRVFGVFFVLIHFSAGRAVNISNTWVLPEEGFPVFYRYFRDRISWYEADAVCQFHHSYLVTADSTSQYDAIRAYLKELDITDNVWIGLSKNADKPFTWTNSLQLLSGEGHWQESIPESKNPLCVAMDPAKDFLWKTFTCGGPEVASFICETPIPSWAAGPRGCLLTELPSLTVLYIPEQSSLELTSDCGLDGTKRIACKGDADREEILKQLTCTISSEDFEDKATKSGGITSPTLSYAQIEGKTTKNSIWTSNTIDVDYGMPTRHRRETEDTLSAASSTESTGKIISTMVTFAATNYDTEVTTSDPPGHHSTMEPVVFNISSPYELEIIQDVPPKATPTDKPSTNPSKGSVSSNTPITENITPTTETTSETPTNITTNSSSSTEISTSTANVGEKDAANVEYPSAISQGQLFSIIENGTMFDIIELNETAEPKEQTSNSDDNQKSKPSTKLAQLDEKNTKVAGDPKNKAQSKKDIYKNADPKKKNMQKIAEEKKQEELIKTTEGKDVNRKEYKENYTTIAVKQKREEREEHIKENPENKTENLDKEETDLKSQVEIFPIKQIEEENIEHKEEDKRIDTKEENFEEPNLKKEVEEFAGKDFKTENKTHIKIDDDIDKQEELIENQRKEEIDLNKEVEFFHIIKDKSPYLNRTFRKELPMLANDEPLELETKDIDENKLELLDDIEETLRTIPAENATKIDPNIDLLNKKNMSKNNESEIIGEYDKDVLKKQLLPKPLQGGEEQTSTTQKETSTEEPIENQEAAGDHPKPNRQRQLTRPHGRPFYPNFFSRVLG